MKRTLTTVAILMLGFLNSYGQTAKDDKVIESNYVNINNLTVFQLIELLKIGKENSKDIPTALIISGRQRPENWLTKSDVDSLITLINSVDSARCIVSPASSYFPFNESSTIGGQILTILKAYRNREMYPIFAVSCAKTNQKQIAEMEDWWNEQKK